MSKFKNLISKIVIVFAMALIFGVLGVNNVLAASTTNTYSENLIPQMSSYTVNGITVSGSSEDTSAYSAWKAFNRVTDTGSGNSWATGWGITTGWIKVDFGIGNEKVISKYTIKCRTYNDNSAPKTWTFEGSNDNVNWIQLDNRTNEINWNYTLGEKREYNFQNSTKYRYYRVNVTTNNGQTSYTDIDEIEMMEELGITTSGITLNKTTDNIAVNGTDQLTATITPDTATNKTVTWTSSDPTVATVDNTGKVTAVKEGITTITATTTDGSNLSATCTVTVTSQNTTPTNPTDNSGNAVLTITMTNGNVKAYTVPMTKVNDFISWYSNRSSGSTGNPYYAFDKTDSSQTTFSKKTEYVVFDKISSFEIDEYSK